MFEVSLTLGNSAFHDNGFLQRSIYFLFCFHFLSWLHSRSGRRNSHLLWNLRCGGKIQWNKSPVHCTFDQKSAQIARNCMFDLGASILLYCKFQLQRDSQSHWTSQIMGMVSMLENSRLHTYNSWDFAFLPFLWVVAVYLTIQQCCGLRLSDDSVMVPQGTLAFKSS